MLLILSLSALVYSSSQKVNKCRKTYRATHPNIKGVNQLAADSSEQARNIYAYYRSQDVERFERVHNNI
ncbi:MAG: hypothetical protein QMC62_11510 [Alteromonadaceae bacterium]